MERKDELLLEVEELEKLNKEYAKKLHKARSDLAVCLCPFKIGDRLKDTSIPKHTVYKLTAIRPKYGNSYDMYGHKIKKDGTPGKREFIMYTWHNTEWTLVEEK